MGLFLCLLAFTATYYFARRSAGAGVLALIAVGYGYGIARANFPDGSSHFIFDAALLGVYLGHFLGKHQALAGERSRDAAFWMTVLALPAFMLFLVPLQHPLIQLIGLRSTVLFLPMIVIGARLDRTGFTTIARGMAVLNLVALAFAFAEYQVGVEPFFPRNQVTAIMYRSADVGALGHLRIPSIFSSAHAYGGTMVASIPFVAALWSGARRRLDRLLGAGALVAAALGVFLCAARQPVVVLALLTACAVVARGLRPKRRLVLVAGIVAVVALASSNERLQRFYTLRDTTFVGARLQGSTNEKLLTLMHEYPLGAGLGRAGGTSVPFFLQPYAAPQIGLENEFSRIIIEEGLIGLALWLVFLLWTLSRRPPPVAVSPFGFQLTRASVLLAFATGLIGTGLLTSIPSTALLMIQLGLLNAQATPGESPAFSRGAVPGMPLDVHAQGES